MASAQPVVSNKAAPSEKLGFFSLSKDSSHLFKVAALVAVVALALLFIGILIATISTPVALVAGGAFFLAGGAGGGCFAFRLEIAVESYLRHKFLNNTKPSATALLQELETTLPKTVPTDIIIEYCFDVRGLAKEGLLTSKQKIQCVAAGNASFDEVGCHTIEAALGLIKASTLSIKKFNISPSQCIENMHFKQIKEACPFLQHLTLTECENLRTGDMVDIRWMHLPNIGISNFSDEGIEHLQGLPLTHLTLIGCNI
jgi:hypothetical protein